MTRNGVLWYSGLEPGLAELVAGLVDRHPGLEIINTAKDKVYPASGEAALGYPWHKMLEVLYGCDIVVVSLELNIRIDIL